MTTAASRDLRFPARSLGLLARVGRDEHVAVLALAVALTGLVEAVTDLRSVRARAEQAAAAYQAAEPLLTFTASAPGRAAHDAVRTPTSAVRRGSAPRPRFYLAHVAAPRERDRY